MYLLGCVLFVNAHSQEKIYDENAVPREVKEFTGINVSGAFDVYISQGNEEAAAVSAASGKDREMITTEVKNGILYIRYNTKGLKWTKGNKELKAYISFKNIEQLTISGACDVFMNGKIKLEKLTLNQSGASDIKKADLEVGRLTAGISGASDVKITGKAQYVTIEASGASSFKGYDLEVEHCNVKASGASDIKITVNKELSAQASGASDIRYKGEGVIRDIKSSGASSISRG